MTKAIQMISTVALAVMMNHTAPSALAADAILPAEAAIATPSY